MYAVIETGGKQERVAEGQTLRVELLGEAPGAEVRFEPVLLVEILSPSNETKTRSNAWAYATIPSVQAVLILASTAVRAEVLRQDEETPEVIAGTETLRLTSIGYTGPLAEFYATTDLV